MAPGRFQESDFMRAHDLPLNNERRIKFSKTCGCYFCLSIYSPDEITDWIDDAGGRNALCPRCLDGTGA